MCSGALSRCDLLEYKLPSYHAHGRVRDSFFFITRVRLAYVADCLAYQLSLSAGGRGRQKINVSLASMIMNSHPLTNTEFATSSAGHSH